MTQATQPWSGQLNGALPVAINARWAERLLLYIALTVVDMTMVLVGFWLAYVENLSEPTPNLNEVDLPEAAEAFLESIDQQES